MTRNKITLNHLKNNLILNEFNVDIKPLKKRKKCNWYNKSWCDKYIIDTMNELLICHYHMDKALDELLIYSMKLWTNKVLKKELGDINYENKIK